MDAACKAQVDENLPVTHKSRRSLSTLSKDHPVNPRAGTLVCGWQALDKYERAVPQTTAVNLPIGQIRY